MTPEEIRARISEIRTRLQEIDTANQGRYIDPESDDGREWRSLNEELEEQDRTLQQIEARQARLRDLDANPEAREDEPEFHTRRAGAARGDDIYDLSSVRMSAASPEAAASELRDRALRSIEVARFPHEHANREDCQSHIERLLQTRDTPAGDLARHLLATGSPTYRRAFGKALSGAPLSNEERTALALTGANGGYAVPYNLDPTVIPTSNSSVNPMRAISRVEQIVNSNTWKGVSSAGVTASRTAEAAEASDNSPTLAQPSATVTKAQAFVPFSIEIGQDWSGLESEMAKLIQDAKDDEEATAFVTGDGTGENPQGVVTGTTTTVAAATGLTVTAANLYALEAALPPRFRARSTFIGNRGIYNVIRGIDTAGGAALWLRLAQGLATQAPNPGNTGAVLLDRPAYEATAMQATVANAAKLLIVGDFGYYLIVDRIGMVVEVVPHLFATANNLPSGQRGLLAYWRNTGKVLSANAFRALTGTT